ncbi:hypothetical protein SISNIDRAFT_191302 [Sistotremastrum niveocremeum HHB9708]|uniref:HBS1-like protein N-terminal domain-containing protein n=1 Tax=Sistotremastrum niveocremeum HHB9708 TaxID=1314777 RepID=A0A164ZC96_9AGAM|nr:hypothetical protein SISNIDRAFT_191302 [Sistotremastrum niveocremeum HHB9708]
MSRHRFVKNLNIHDELAVDRYDEEDVDEIPQMTPEQRVQLDSASAEVRRLLGPEDTSGFSNDDIRAAVWDSYFDVEESVKWLLDEQAKAREREGNPRPISYESSISSLHRDDASDRRRPLDHASAKYSPHGANNPIAKLESLRAPSSPPLSTSDRSDALKPTKTSKLATLSASRSLRASQSEGTRSSDSYEDNFGIPLGQNGSPRSSISRGGKSPSDVRESAVKPLPGVPAAGMESHVAQFFAEEHDDVEFDSERFNEEVIAVPRLSTITEKTEATEVPRRSKLASLAASRTSNISGSRTPSATPVGSRSHGPPAFRTASLSSQIPYAPSYASTVPSERSHQGMRPVSATSHRHIQEVDASPSLTSLSGMAQSLPQIPGSSAHSIASASRNSASSIKTKLSSRKGSVLENEVASETTTSPTPIIPASAATSPSTAPSEAGTTRPSLKLANLAQVRVHRLLQSQLR